MQAKPVSQSFFLCTLYKQFFFFKFYSTLMFMTFLFKLTIAFLEVVYIHMKNCFIYSKPFFWFDSTILAFDVWETVANLASFFAQVLILCLSGNDSIALPFFNHLQLYYWEKVNSKHLKRFKSGFRTLNRFIGKVSTGQLYFWILGKILMFQSILCDSVSIRHSKTFFYRDRIAVPWKSPQFNIWK